MYRLKDGRKVRFVNVFDLDNIEKLKEFQQTVTNNKGVVYAFEIGNAVKIGCTKNPYDRIKTHYKTFNAIKKDTGDTEIKFGTIVMTDPCFNYFALENRLHRKFKYQRITGTEFFNVDLDNVVLSMDKEFEIDEIGDDYQVEVLFSNLLHQLSVAMDTHGNMLAVFANALVMTGKQLGNANERINELEEILHFQEQTN